MTTKQKKLLYWSAEGLIVLLILAVCFKLSFLFRPIGIFISSVFTPVLISGILFYLLNPIIHKLTKIHIKKYYLPKTVAILSVFLVILILFLIIAFHLVPDLIQQITNLTKNVPRLSRQVGKTFRHLEKYKTFRQPYIKHYISLGQSYLSSGLLKFLKSFLGNLGNVVSIAATVLINAITIPFMLFYMLKDGNKFTHSILKVVPPKQKKKSLKLLQKMSSTLSKYIDGQLLECLFVGCFTIIGFLLIHQPYAILLGAFGGLCVIIPYLGPYIGIFPAIMMALTISVRQALFVVIVVLIVEQIDGNIIYPNVIGKSIHVHPLTIIIILLAAGNIAGILGMVLAIPAYAILKTVLVYVCHLYRQSQEGKILNDKRRK